MSLKYGFPVALLIVLSLTQTACYLPPECDPASDVYDLEECRRDSDYYELLARLTDLAYGDPDNYEPSPNECPISLFCSPTNCIFAGENGNFRDFKIPPWTGDEVQLSIFGCKPRNYSLGFEATTPDSASSSISSQVFQVIDYNALVPAMARNLMRRVRAQAAFQAGFPPFDPEPEQDSQFGLRIEAYHGDLSAFPQAGDPEEIPRETARYRRIGFSEATFIYDFEGEDWQPLRTHLMVSPDSTSFLVIFLEAIENTVNETTEDEFEHSRVTNVQVAIDAGPYPPTALSDEATTRQDEPVDIHVLFNDRDPDDRIDPATVRVIVPPQQGTADVNADGTITYTPASGYVGTDRLSYNFTDRDGFSAGALVTIEVIPVNRPPVANHDTFDVITGTSAELDLLANDTDPDGDPIHIIAVGLRDKVEIINEGQAVRYTPDPGFTGNESFGYVISDDKGALSGEGIVSVNVNNANRAPVASDPIRDMMVNVDPAGTCSFDLDDHFSDPDGDVLSYTHSLTTNAATVLINGSTITITGFTTGQTTVEVNTQDPGGLGARDTFIVTVAFGATDCAGNASTH